MTRVRVSGVKKSHWRLHRLTDNVNVQLLFTHSGLGNFFYVKLGEEDE